MRRCGIRAQDLSSLSGHHDRLPALPADGGQRLDRQFQPSNGIKPGRRTSPTFQPTRAGCTWRWSKTCTRGRSSAGRWPSESTANSSRRRWNGAGARTAWRGPAGPQRPRRAVRQRRYQQLLAKHGIECSMSRKGNCWDNAPTEASGHAQERTGPSGTLRHAVRGTPIAVRVHRGVLQSPAVALVARLPHAGRGPRPTCKRQQRRG